MQDIIIKIKDIIKKPLFLKIAVGVGLLIMIIIAFSDFSGKDKEVSRSSDINTDTAFVSADLYAQQMEVKLIKLLSTVEGVGKTEIMLTIKSTEEYEYAETYRQGTSQAENSYVIIDKGSQKKEALVKKINNPSISGVVIVCEGGDNSKVCEKVYKTVSTALNIPTNGIYVTEMK